MIETPSGPKAAQCVPCADESDDGGHKKFERWRIVRPVREEEGCKETAQHKHSGAKERALSNIKETGQHHEDNYDYSIQSFTKFGGRGSSEGG